MSVNFDPGYGNEPFLSLCDQVPDESVYPFSDFRREWGPVFHRGRLDGTARVLGIGQDPAEHETIARRILIGTAGHRAQGFLAKLGMTRSYVLVNTYLFSVYGQAGGNKHIGDAKISAYRNKWITALLANSPIEVVVSFGGLADKAWQAFLGANGQYEKLPYQHVPHPTSPEGQGGTAAQIAAATKTMLINYNAAITALRTQINTPDGPGAPLYGSAFSQVDLPLIPAFDFPAGSPAWMQGPDNWAARVGTSAALKRRTITITVPDDIIPGASA